MIHQKRSRARTVVTRFLAVLALLGLYALTMSGLALTTAAPAAAQRGNRAGRGRGQGQGQGQQFQSQSQGQGQARRGNKAAKIIGTIGAVGAVVAPFFAPPPPVEYGYSDRRRRRRRRYVD